MPHLALLCIFKTINMIINQGYWNKKKKIRKKNKYLVYIYFNSIWIFRTLMIMNFRFEPTMAITAMVFRFLLYMDSIISQNQGKVEEVCYFYKYQMIFNLFKLQILIAFKSCFDNYTALNIYSSLYAYYRFLILAIYIGSIVT